MQFGTMDADMTALGKTAAMGTADAATSPESVLLGYSVGENRDRADAAGPVGRLAAASDLRLPPLMIRHGDADPLIAPTQSERLAGAWATRPKSISPWFPAVATVAAISMPMQFFCQQRPF
jgi:hypothetical protein